MSTASRISCTLGRLTGKPFAGAFQIDDVQVLGALLGELPGDRRRIVGEDGLLLVVALPQPDALSAAQVDRRPDLHGTRSVRVRRPSRHEWTSAETQNMPHRAARDKGPTLRASRFAAEALARDMRCRDGRDPWVDTPRLS